MLLERRKTSERAGAFKIMDGQEIAILLPCDNEASGIRKVIEDFRRSLPDVSIYVYGDNSRDETVLIARETGAIVRREPQQGKGHVVRRMFADVEVEIYVDCDADGREDCR